MKVYDVRHCIGAKAITCREVTKCGDGKCVVYQDYGPVYLRLGSDAFESLADAKAEAEKMRQKKIASLKKQIAKLEATKFDVEE